MKVRGVNIVEKGGYSRELVRLEEIGKLLGGGIYLENIEDIRVSRREIKVYGKSLKIKEKREELVRKLLEKGGDKRKVDYAGGEVPVFRYRAYKEEGWKRRERLVRFEKASYFKEGMEVVSRGRSGEIGSFIKEQLEGGERVQGVLRFVKEALMREGKKGRIEVKGRILGRTRTRKIKARTRGGILGKWKEGGGYSRTGVKTRYGMSSIKIWIK